MQTLGSHSETSELGLFDYGPSTSSQLMIMQGAVYIFLP